MLGGRHYTTRPSRYWCIAVVHGGLAGPRLAPSILNVLGHLERTVRLGIGGLHAKFSAFRQRLLARISWTCMRQVTSLGSKRCLETLRSSA